MINIPRYVDASNYTQEGGVAFLVHSVRDGVERWSLHETPLRTNQSRLPRLHGWCGETDNVSRTAHGLVRIERVTEAGDRALITQLEGDELSAALEEHGYPELKEQAP